MKFKQALNVLKFFASADALYNEPKAPTALLTPKDCCLLFSFYLSIFF